MSHYLDCIMSHFSVVLEPPVNKEQTIKQMAAEAMKATARTAETDKQVATVVRSFAEYLRAAVAVDEKTLKSPFTV